MWKRLIVIVVLGAVAAGGAVWFKLGRVDAATRAAREEVRAVLAELPSYRADAAYVDGLLDWAHPAAMGASLERRNITGATVRVTEYQQRVTGAMLERARADGQTVVARELALLRAREGWDEE